MEAQGMVHALEEIRRLLRPAGVLIDIHPVRKAPLIQVARGEQVLFVEPDPGYDYDDDLQHADEALEAVTRRGVYRLEGREEFEFVTHASSASEMAEYWAEYLSYEDEPEDQALASRRAEIYARAQAIMRDAVDAKLTYHERVRITRLVPGAPEHKEQR